MKNYFISTNACCYDDFLRYYLNREFLKQMAVDNISDPQYSSVYGPFGKRIETAPYKKYELTANTGFVYPFNNWTKAQINGFADAAAFMADVATKTKSLEYGVPITNEDGSTSARPGWGTGWAEGDESKPVPATALKGIAFTVEGDEGSTIWTPKGDTTLYEIVRDASTDNKFIFVDFHNVYSPHFDTYWSRVEACNSSWDDSTKAANKAQAQSLLGCSMYTAQDPIGKPDGSIEIITNTIKNYPLGYPTYIDGIKNDRVHVLEIDKLLDKDSATMTDLATFMGISVSDDASTVIDTFLNDIR